MVLITTFTSVPCSSPCSAFYKQPLTLIEPMIGTSNNIIIIDTIIMMKITIIDTVKYRNTMMVNMYIQ